MDFCMEVEEFEEDQLTWEISTFSDDPEIIE